MLKKDGYNRLCVAMTDYLGPYQTVLLAVNRCHGNAVLLLGILLTLKLVQRCGATPNCA